MNTQHTPEPVYCKHGLCHHHCSDCREEYVFALRQQRDELLSAVTRYGKHDSDCPIKHGMKRCNCGFDAVIAKARGQQ